MQEQSPGEGRLLTQPKLPLSLPGRYQKGFCVLPDRGCWQVRSTLQARVAIRVWRNKESPSVSGPKGEHSDPCESHQLVVARVPRPSIWGYQ